MKSRGCDQGETVADHHLARAVDNGLLAGKEKGVFMDYPHNQDLISLITPDTYPLISNKINASESTDVTGGMASKVKSMLDLITFENNLSVNIFSGEKAENLYKAISGEKIGTRISR